MHLNALVEEVCADGSSSRELVGKLDASAPILLAGVRCDRLFVDRFEHWRNLDHRGRPWARLLIGTTGILTAPDEARQLTDSARQSFRRRGDRYGEGAALCQLGDIVNTVGDLERAASYWLRAHEQLEDGALAALNRAKLAAISLGIGELHRALRLVDEATALADADEAPRVAAIVHSWRAVINALSGHFDVTEASLDVAHDLWTTIEYAREEETYALLWFVRGFLHGLRGESMEGLRLASLGVELARVNGARWLEAWVLSSRAEHFATEKPHDRLCDAQRALALADELDEPRVRMRAARARAVVMRVFGQAEASRDELMRCLETDPTPFEHSGLLIRLGEAEHDLGNDVAAATHFERAARMAASAGTEYLEALAVARLAELDGERAAVFCRPGTDAPACRRLLTPATKIEISLLGVPTITVNGETVRFPTRASMLVVVLLALAPEGAMHRDELIEAIWPEVSPEHGSQSLRTALWRTKRALGEGSEHLSRTGDAVCLDLEHVGLDITRHRDQAQAILETEQPVPGKLIDALRTQVAVPWRYEEWAVTEKSLNDELATTLEELATRVGTRETR